MPTFSPETLIYQRGEAAGQRLQYLEKAKGGKSPPFLCPKTKDALQFDPSARHGKCAVDFFKEAL